MEWLSLSRLELQLSFPLATILLCVCIFTTTFPEYQSSLRWFRLALALPTTLIAWAATFPPSVPESSSKPGIYSTIFVYGSYLLMRTIDICFVGFGSKDVPPRLLKRKEKGKADGVEYVTLPLPTTLKGRLAYTIDNFLSMRGSSLFENCSWEWAQRNIREYRPRSRITYLQSRLKSLAISFVLFDIFESILVRQKWDLTHPYPMTSLPVSQQIYYTLAEAVITWVGMDIAFGYAGLLFVNILGFPPSSSPPMYDGHPFNSTSLAEFWSLKWHTSFRRNSTRITVPFIRLICGEPTGTQRSRFSSRATLFIQSFAIFLVTTILHVGIAFSIPTLRRIDPSTVMFFLAQPLGVLFEALLLKPATERLPEGWKVAVRRTFLWCWFVWTGRWYCDGYMKYGQFEKKEIVYSPAELVIRGWRYRPAVMGVVQGSSM